MGEGAGEHNASLLDGCRGTVESTHPVGKYDGRRGLQQLTKGFHGNSSESGTKKIGDVLAMGLYLNVDGPFFSI